METKKNSKDNEVKVAKKTQMCYMQAPTLGRLLSNVKYYNKEYPDAPILREDIVDVVKEGGEWILIYYA